MRVVGLAMAIAMTLVLPLSAAGADVAAPWDEEGDDRSRELGWR